MLPRITKQSIRADTERVSGIHTSRNKEHSTGGQQEASTMYFESHRAFKDIKYLQNDGLRVFPDNE